ncbi:TonB-dependent receptor [Methylocystis sp. B8]|uniref:TonB-dependent receptor n=1 Tax=Methylocystis sp. B8 TaxID=544938 RepID=UPI0010FD70F3|nr:TonB-dependent receptor [Methylocystis sp. B8]TLG78056.1 TonB-dependent receptor [Methylocystis sp. B8]
MRKSVFTRVAVGGAAVALFISASAVAQQALPTIEVGAVSPIAGGKTAAAPQSPHAPGGRSRSVARPSGPEPRETAVAPQGVLPIVADQFATVTVVTNEELRRSPGATLGDVLFAKPGVTGSTFAPGAASRPIVRGLDNYRVRIQENGVSNSGVSELGEDHAVPIDPVAASQVEVVRGPATLRWGSQAIGGVVNVENNRIPTALPCRLAFIPTAETEGCAIVETRGAVMTVDNGLENATLLDAGRGNVAVHMDVHGRRGSDYRIPGYPYLYPPDPPPPVFGRQPNSSMRSAGGSAGASYFFDGGFVGFAVTQFNSRYHIPGIEPTQANTRIELRQTRATSKGEFRPQSAYIEAVRFWAGLTDYKHHELANEGGFDGVQQTFTNKDLEARVETQLRPVDLSFAILTSAFGVQGMHQILTSPGREGGLFDPNRTRSVAGYWFNEFRLTDTSRTQLAGRIEHATVSGAFPELLIDPALQIARVRNFTPKSAAFGFLQDLPEGVVASLTAQYVERAPRAPELFSRGAHEATGTFDIGNPNLGIEAAKTIEIGLRRPLGPFRFEATAYLMRFDGFIFRNLTGAVCEADFASCAFDGAGDLRQAFYAQRNALFRGAEFQSQLDVAPLLDGVFGVEQQFDVVRATFVGGGNVPRIPPVRLGGGVFWRDISWFARVNLLHAFAQRNIDPSNETPTKGYNLLRAEISYRMLFDPGDPRGRELALGLVGDNLLNDDIRNSVSFRKDEVLLPGANLRLFVNARF